jgi:hypothetical protein
VVNTLKVGCISPKAAANLRPTVGTAVLNDMHTAILGPSNYHWNLTNKCCFEITRVGNFRFKGNERPGLSTEYFFLFSGEEFFLRKNSVGNAMSILHSGLQGGFGFL